MRISSRTGAFLVAAAFAVYYAFGIASWYMDASVILFTIAGTILLYIGASRLLKDAPKLWTYGVLGLLVVAYFLSRILNAWEFGPTPAFDDFARYGYFVAAQSLAFTLAACLALAYRPDPVVRGLCALAVVGVLAYTFLDFTQTRALFEGTATYEQARTALVLVLLLDNLVIFAGIAAAVRMPQEDQPSLQGEVTSAPATPAQAVPQTEE